MQPSHTCRHSAGSKYMTKLSNRSHNTPRHSNKLCSSCSSHQPRTALLVEQNHKVTRRYTNAKSALFQPDQRFDSLQTECQQHCMPHEYSETPTANCYTKFCDEGRSAALCQPASSVENKFMSSALRRAVRGNAGLAQPDKWAQNVRCAAM